MHQYWLINCNKDTTLILDNNECGRWEEGIWELYVPYILNCSVNLKVYFKK